MPPTAPAAAPRRARQGTALSAALVCLSFSLFGTANAALLDLTGGSPQTTPNQTGNPTTGNDVITASVPFFDNATISTTAPLLLTFFYVGAESGYNNTLNVAGAPPHTENSVFPGNWNGTPLFSISLAANQAVPMFFTSDGPGFLPVAPGGGNLLSGGNYDRSIGFAVLTCAPGSPGWGSAACFSQNMNLRTGNIIAFMLDDGGANVDDNHDDYVGYMIATPAPVPLPAAGWLLLSGLGVLGAAARRSKG